MLNNYLIVFIPVVGLLINVLIQIGSFRAFPKLGLLTSVLLGFTVGFLGAFLLEGYLCTVQLMELKDSIAIFIINIVAYFSLAYCYFHFINLGETARRIRILRELKEAPQGLSLNEILNRYNAREIIERRISRLIQTGQIKLKNEKFYIGKPLVLVMAKFIVVSKIILLGKKSEFD